MGTSEQKIGPKGNDMGVISSYCMPKGNRTKGNKNMGTNIISL